MCDFGKATSGCFWNCVPFCGRIRIVTSLRPSDAIWWHKTWSTLAQVIGNLPYAPSQYMNQYLLINHEVLWHSHGSNFAWFLSLELLSKWQILIWNPTVAYFMGQLVNSLRPRQNGRHFPDDIFKRIFLNENVWISIKMSLKFVPRVRINNIPALVKIMAWRRSGDRPLFEPMLDNLLTHICATRLQWVERPLMSPSM